MKRLIADFIVLNLIVIACCISGCTLRPNVPTTTVLGSGPGDELRDKEGDSYNDPNYEKIKEQKRIDKEVQKEKEIQESMRIGPAESDKEEVDETPRIGPPDQGINILGPKPKVKRRRIQTKDNPGGFQGRPRVTPRCGGCR